MRLCGGGVPRWVRVRRAECARARAARTVRSTRAHVAPASSSWHKVSTSWQDGPIVTMTAPRTHQFARPQRSATTNMLLQPVAWCTNRQAQGPLLCTTCPFDAQSRGRASEAGSADATACSCRADRSAVSACCPLASNTDTQLPARQRVPSTAGCRAYMHLENNMRSRAGQATGRCLRM